MFNKLSYFPLLNYEKNILLENVLFFFNNQTYAGSPKISWIINTTNNC